MENVRSVRELARCMKFRAPSVVGALANKQPQYLFESIQTMDPNDLFVVSDNSNRPITKPHVRVLLEQIAASGLIGVVIVDDDYVVMDGQHRVMAAALLGHNVEVAKYVKTDNKESIIQSLNSTQKNWTNADHMRHLQRFDVKILPYFTSVKKRTGEAVIPMDTFLSIYLKRATKFKDFKKLPPEEMNRLFEEDKHRKMMRTNKFTRIICNLLDMIGIKSYIFFDAVGKHLLEIDIDSIDSDRYCEKLVSCVDLFESRLPQTATDWLGLLRECYN